MTVRFLLQCKHSLLNISACISDHVIRASRIASNPNRIVEAAQQEEEEEEDLKTVEKDEDNVMAEDIPALPKKQRKPKKQIPIGRNGIKKKRVIKSKTSVDAKGFMGTSFLQYLTRLTEHSYPVTEDYSSYESVDEEEPEAAPTKGKSRAKATAERKDNDSDTGPPAPAKSKPSLKPSTSLKSKPSVGAGSSKGGQKNIAAFFGKPKAK